MPKITKYKRYLPSRSTVKQQFVQPLPTRQFIYSEGNHVLITSRLGTAKMKTDPSAFFTQHGPLMKIHYKFFDGVLKKPQKEKPGVVMTKAERQLRFFIRNMNFIAKRRFMVRGRGFRMLQDNNNLAFKVNYTNLVYHVLPPNVRIYPQKKGDPWIPLGSLFAQTVGNQTYRIQSYRIPYQYIRSGKGIFRFNKPVLFKSKKTRG